MPGILSPFKAIGRGILAAGDAGVRNLSGGYLDPSTLDPSQRGAARAAAFSDLGAMLLSRGQAGPMAVPNLTNSIVAQRQAEQLKREKAARAAALAQAQQTGGNQALANAALLQGDSALANAAANVDKSFAKPEKEDKVFKTSDFTVSRDANGNLVKGIVTQEGFTAIPGLELTWHDTHQIVGNDVIDLQSGERTSASKEPTYKMLNGRVVLSQIKDGKVVATELDGSPASLKPGDSLVDVPDDAKGQVFQGLLNKHDGDAAKAFEDFNKFTAADSDSSIDAAGAASIAQGIASGALPPSYLSRLSRRDAAPVLQALADMGVDVTARDLDYTGQRRATMTLNSAPMQRLRQATTFTSKTMEDLRGLNKDLTAIANSVPGFRTRFPVMNRAAISAAKNGLLGDEAQKKATQVDVLMAELIPEIATVFRGGQTPTEEAMKHAKDLLNSAWSEGQLSAAIDLVGRNLNYRLQSIDDTPTITYTGEPYLSPSMRDKQQEAVPGGTRLERGPDGKLRLAQ